MMLAWLRVLFGLLLDPWGAWRCRRTRLDALRRLRIPLMTDRTLAMNEDYVEKGLALAERLQSAFAGEDGPTVIISCCWIMAALIVQANDLKRESVERSIALVTAQLIECIARLQDTQLPTETTTVFH